MVRGLFLFFIFTFSSFGLDLHSNIKSIISEQNYALNRDKIDQIFAVESEFIDSNDNLNYAKITNALRVNSLLNLSYSQPINLEISFYSPTSDILMFKSVSEALKSLGYSYFLSKSLKSDTQGIVWQITMNSRFILDPGALYKELSKNYIFIKDIKRDGQFSFVYSIDATKAVLSTHQYISDIEYDLNKPLEPYFLNISNKSEALIKSYASDRWICVIKVLDRDLNLITQIKSDKPEKEVYIKFPPNSYYMLIDDAFSLENIKRGLKIYIKSN
ncbi:hypothetical protein [Campylobacter vicugnae]|uniref:Periplasmic protein n=1 Tax=Campylobacter vicugnae TaxID=1660076 RepID=A0A1X9T2V4_9BACT|nr:MULTISPECIES: hypothetical protein [unclassified Campylobacter]ARR02801.1 hypothetical protein CVIC8964_1415 [Campylobacter sp. RM8964]